MLEGKNSISREFLFRVFHTHAHTFTVFHPYNFLRAILLFKGFLSFFFPFFAEIDVIFVEAREYSWKLREKMIENYVLMGMAWHDSGLLSAECIMNCDSVMSIRCYKSKVTQQQNCPTDRMERKKTKHEKNATILLAKPNREMKREEKQNRKRSEKE